MFFYFKSVKDFAPMIQYISVFCPTLIQECTFGLKVLIMVWALLLRSIKGNLNLLI